MSEESLDEALESARKAMERLKVSLSTVLEIYALTNEEYDIEWLADIAEKRGYNLTELVDIWKVQAKKGRPYDAGLLANALEAYDAGMTKNEIKRWIRLEITRRKFAYN